MTMMPVSSQLTSTATSEGGQELSPLRMVRVQSPAALLSGVLGRDPPPPEGSHCDYSGDVGTARRHLPER